jgi:hypothetical protein
MIRFKDSEPTKGKGAPAKSDEKEAAKPAVARAPAASEPEPERAPKAAAKRKKNFGG